MCRFFYYLFRKKNNENESKVKPEKDIVYNGYHHYIFMNQHSKLKRLFMERDRDTPNNKLMRMDYPELYK